MIRIFIVAISLGVGSVAFAQTTNLITVVGTVSRTNLFTVQNTGTGTLIGAGVVNGPFYFSGPAVYSLAAGESASFGMYFQPAAAGFITNPVSWTGGGDAVTFASGIGCVGLPLTGFSATNGTRYGFTNAGAIIAQPTEVGDPQSGGRSYYCFYITNAGNYYISNTVHAPDTGANSAYLRIDDEPNEPYWVWNAPVSAVATNVAIAIRGAGTGATNQFDPYVATLTAGWHQIVLAGREAGMEIGQFVIAPQAAPALAAIPTQPRIMRLLLQ